MKTKLTLIRSSIILSALAFAAIFSSCKKDNQYDFKSTVYANVNLVNTSPDAGASSLYIAGILRTPTPVAYGNASGYNKTYVGSQLVEIKSSNNNAVIASATEQLDANTNYSFYLVGQGNSLSIVFAQDDTKAPASGKAKVRFVNASAALGTADLLINNAALFSSQAIKSASAFTEVTAGTVAAKVTSPSFVGSIGSNFTLEAGKTYTIYIKGTAGATGAGAMGLGIVAQGQ